MKTDRPNILLLFADQFRFDAISCVGNTEVRTPHLDNLARSGVRFTNAFTPTPVCVAARMSLITGQRASRTGVPANTRLPGYYDELPTIMTLLGAAGYRTHGVGKMHFSGRHYGFHALESMEECPGVRVDDDYLMYLRTKGIRTRYPHGQRDLLYFQPQTSAIPVEHSPNNWVADRSIEFLKEHRRHRGTQPFFLWSSWISPHPPFAPCEPYASMYDPAEMSLPFFTDRPISTLPARGNRARLDGAHLDPDRMRRIKALYYGLVSHVDDSVGRILQALDELGQSDNTVVIFASDHGEMLGNHGLSQKNVPYEHSIRIPFIMRWPGRTHAGTESSDLVSLLDVMPTLIHGLGLGYPTNGPTPAGESLIAKEGGGPGTDRDAIFIDYGEGPARWIAMRSKRHLYALWSAGGYEELYDIHADPEERHNLVQEFPELCGRMRERVLDWERVHGFSSSFDRLGFRTFPLPEAGEEHPRAVVRNMGRWPENLPPDEADTVESFAESFTSAIRYESTLAPEKLSVELYKKKGGDLRGTPWEEAWLNCSG